MLRLEVAMQTDIGLRPTNQDSLFARAEKFKDDIFGLFCVSDGMGGLTDGHFASATASEAVESWYNRQLQHLLQSGFLEERRILAELSELFLEINSIILHHAQDIESKIGTTCSLLLILNNRFYIAHVGDSRIYILAKRWFNKSHIQQLTEDHSWSADQLRQGLLSIDEINAHPKKNKLTSCLGVFDNPRFFTLSGILGRRGTLILCSDGLYRAVDEKEMTKMNAKYKNCAKLANNLIRMAKRRGMSDNISVITVKYRN
jgi:serine/threonine protein phosphatase PrpC